MGFFNSKEKILQAENSQLKAQIQQLQIQCQKLNQDNVELQQKLNSLGYNDYVSAQNVLADLNKRIKANEDRVEELQYEKSNLLILLKLRKLRKNLIKSK